MELSEDLLKLSSKEIQTLQLAAAGKTSVEMAAELGISNRTVEMRIANIMVELNAKSRAHAVAIGIRTGIIA